MEIEKLIIKAKKGDKEALLQLILAKQTEYYRLAYVYTQNREDALDAMENMIVILYENVQRLKNNQSFYGWSNTVLVNCCRALLRKRNRVVPLELVNEMPGEDSIPIKDEQIMLEGHLSRLSNKHREVLQLRYYLDMDYQGIADLLKIPVGTVKSRISAGLARLRESMGGE
ncbi:MAG: RNA polymerase sigma factor [Deltaproteobacteria bacterium]